MDEPGCRRFMLSAIGVCHTPVAELETFPVRRTIFRSPLITAVFCSILHSFTAFQYPVVRCLSTIRYPYRSGNNAALFAPAPAAAGFSGNRRESALFATSSVL